MLTVRLSDDASNQRRFACDETTRPSCQPRRRGFVMRLLVSLAVGCGALATCAGTPPCVTETDASGEISIPDERWAADPRRAGDLLEEAKKAVEKEQWRLALQLIEKAMSLDNETDPACREYYALRALCSEALGDAGPSAAVELYNQGVIAANRGALANAKTYYDEALVEDPGMLWAANNRAWLGATHPELVEARDPDLLAYAMYACHESGWHDWSFLDTLGAVLAKEGRFEEAGRCAERAQRLAPAIHQPELAAAIVGYRHGMLRSDSEPVRSEKSQDSESDSRVVQRGDVPAGPAEEFRLFKSISKERLMEVMEREGFAVREVGDSFLEWRIDGYKSQMFIGEDGESLQFHSSFADDAVSLADVNAWNQQYRYSRSYLDDDDDPHLELDLDLAGGVTEARITDFLRTCRLSFVRWVETVIDR